MAEAERPLQAAADRGANPRRGLRPWRVMRPVARDAAWRVARGVTVKSGSDAPGGVTTDDR